MVIWKRDEVTAPALAGLDDEATAGALGVVGPKAQWPPELLTQQPWRSEGNFNTVAFV